MKYFSSGSDIRQNSNRLQLGKTVENVTGRDFATFLFHIFLVTPFAGTLWNIMCVCGGGRFFSSLIFMHTCVLHVSNMEIGEFCRGKQTHNIIYMCVTSCVDL